jgi:hypothetical protein
MDQIWKNLPRDVLHIILKLNGTIIFKNGKYYDINKLKENDFRYTILRPVILKKTDIILDTECYNGRDFYFDFTFNDTPKAGLCYDFGFLKRDTFEICYFDYRPSRCPDGPWLQIRTII